MTELPTPNILATHEEAARLAGALASAPAVAVDLESDGLFAYRARPCVAQLAWHEDGATRVAVVDVMACGVGALAPLLGSSGPVKIVHDVAFDARLLAESGIELGRVHDTSIAARMLGRTATGLATTLETELGVKVAKELQHHDWRVRPLEPAHVAYLVGDVVHLLAARDALWSKVTALGIEEEVLEETRYRIATAVASARAPEGPPRVKGMEKLGGVELAVARRLAHVREEEARRRDVPPHRVAAAEAMLAVARARPATEAQLVKMRAVPRGAEPSLVEAMLGAVREGIADAARGPILRDAPSSPRVPPETLRARRDREARLTKWRKEEAKRRGVDEQVVLPGHCLRELAAIDQVESERDLAHVPGLGAFRVARDGAAILRAMTAEAAR